MPALVTSASLVCAFLTVTKAVQPSAPSPISAPLRQLPWGQLNFLHTTDTHGWHAGHLQEPFYSADWGDYVSFAGRLRQKADRDGSDLVLIDTGDRVDGNGLYDASDPKGKFTTDIFKEQDIDVICSGNHELYKQNTSEREYLETVPNFPGNYLASNIDIYDPENGDKVPLAQRYRKFTTKNQGIRILAFGFLYDFEGNENNTVVQPVEQTIEEKWFQQAIRDREVDLFVVAGHAPLRSPEFDLIFKAIRGQQWDVPIQFFGGHTHIRDYAKYDSKAFGLESGRYMETIGFMSISGLGTGAKESRSQPIPGVEAMIAAPKFSRRYIDNNLYSFHHHTSLNSSTFPTDHGRNVSSSIASARKVLALDKRLGCAPKDLWTNRAPYPSDNSIHSWIQDKVFPDMIEDSQRKEIPRIALTNTGALRFDIFEGPFTIDTMYSVSPFTSGFRFIKEVPFEIAKKLLTILNQEMPVLEQGEYELRAKLPVASGTASTASRWQETQTALHPIRGQQVPLTAAEDENPTLSPGYTTTDDAGNDGDDTEHAKITFYKVPNCVESRIGFPTSSGAWSSSFQGDPETVDLVYVDFLQPYVLLALKFLGSDLAEADTDIYMQGSTMTSVIADWVRGNWKDEC